MSTIDPPTQTESRVWIHPTTLPSAADAATAQISRYHGPQRIIKRSLDLTVAVLALPLLLPVFILISLGIVISSPGNPFFCHRRVGRDGREFGMIKFRTMCRDAEHRLHSEAELYARYVANDFKLGICEDPRIFGFGRLLRAASLDELPQLINVVLGQMSLVGPRPVERAQLTTSYGNLQATYLSMRPGITGLWQVSGRGGVRFPERATLDAEYLDHWTIWSDIGILLRTIPSVVRRRGCN